MNGSIFGGMAPQAGGMFGQQQQSPLMQLLGGGAPQGLDPQMMQILQRLMAASGPSAAPQSIPQGGMVQAPSPIGGMGAPQQPMGQMSPILQMLMQGGMR